MQDQFPLYPEQASNFAPHVDAVILYVTAVCLFFALGITSTILFFFLRYARKNPGEIGAPIHGDMRLETAWIIVPLIWSLTMFAWGAVVYVNYRVAPSDTLDIYVIGKQWMWKIQQPTGLREINELHVPTGRDVKLIMGSEDVTPLSQLSAGVPGAERDVRGRRLELGLGLPIANVLPRLVGALRQSGGT